jgi:uncharacterized SAM-binding protein YcdF (DUF218 family)
VRALKSSILGFLCLAALWTGGLIWFANAIPTEVADPSSVTDAIVVLTGGSQRLGAGVRLLQAGMAQKLFVTGVNPGVELPELLKTASAPAGLACCIVLGHEADNTRGNALETAAFMRTQGYHSLRLVTSSYHMPRSLYEFSRAMPGITIVPHPVFAENVKQDEWWAWPGTLNLIAVEYVKYLAAILRPALVPEARG